MFSSFWSITEHLKNLRKRVYIRKTMKIPKMIRIAPVVSTQYFSKTMKINMTWKWKRREPVSETQQVNFVQSSSTRKNKFNWKESTNFRKKFIFFKVKSKILTPIPSSFYVTRSGMMKVVVHQQCWIDYEQGFIFRFTLTAYA